MEINFLSSKTDEDELEHFFELTDRTIELLKGLPFERLSEMNKKLTEIQLKILVKCFMYYLEQIEAQQRSENKII